MNDGSTWARIRLKTENSLSVATLVKKVKEKQEDVSQTFLFE